jgi:gamma-glutamylcyclotransferase (GGCT)/AIG2-like uncharacterized protein YtfP
MTSYLYAFYGSLRRGFHNYERFEPHLRYQFSCWLKGYQLYSFGEFPFAVKTHRDEDKILVEIFEITDAETQKQIDDLELGYGYFVETIMIDKQPVKIYLLEKSANYPLVIGGDWMKFFRG